MTSNVENKPEGFNEQDNDAEEHIETKILSEDEATKLLDGATEVTPDEPEDELAKAKAEAEDNWNNYLRTVAELDNVRKRAARDVEKARRYGVEGLAAELLGVADSLEMGLEAAENASAEALIEGKEATLKQLRAALEKFGVTAVSPEGEPFDPEFHEALTMQESTTVEPNSVIAVVQRGYQLNGRLLRPARVIVAKEP